MKNQVVLGLALIALSPSLVLAQALPDEVDHVRYNANLQTLQGRLKEAQTRLSTLQGQREQLRVQIGKMEDDRDKLPGRNEDLDEVIADSRAQDAELETEIRSLSATINRVGADVVRVQAEAETLRQSWTREEQRRQQFAQALDQHSGNVNTIQAQLEREVGEEREAAQNLDRADRQIDRMTRRVQDLEGERRGLIQQNRQDERDLPERRRALQTGKEQLEYARSQINPGTEALNAARTTLSQKEGALNAVIGRLTPVSNRAEALRAQSNRLTGAISASERESNEAQATLRSLETRKSQAGGNIAALEAARPGLQAQAEAARASIAPAEAALAAAQEKLNADQMEFQAARDALRNAPLRGPQRVELQNAVNIAEAKLAESRNQLGQRNQAAIAARVSVGGLEAQFTQNQQQINQLNAFLGSVDGDMAAQRAKIESANAQVAAKREELNSARQGLQAAEAELAQVSGERDRLTPDVQRARQELTTAERRLQQSQENLRRLEGEVRAQSEQVVAMERGIANFPSETRRIAQAMEEAQRDIRERQRDAERERRLLNRISDDRGRVQGELANAQANAVQAARDLEAQTAAVVKIEADFAAKDAQRVQLQEYVTTSRGELTSNQTEQQRLRQVVVDAQREIGLNRDRLVQIGRDLPPAQARAAQSDRDVAAADGAVTGLQTQVENADTQYRQRLSLYQRYLGEARSLGQSRAGDNGARDGRTIGGAAAVANATTLGTESGGREGRWEGQLRGFVRGEVSGFNTGKAEGLASDVDAARGTQEGTTLGRQEARDHANQVLKPRIYSEEFAQRLLNTEVEEAISDEARVAMASLRRQNSTQKRNEGNVPVLTAQELQASRTVVTSLDTRIQQAIDALAVLRRDQEALKNPLNVYTVPANVEAAINGDTCQGVYKNVADFTAACQGSYRTEYRNRYLVTHREAFIAGYPTQVEASLAQARAAGLTAEYGPRYAEAQAVARVVGLAEGKEEVYRVRFAEARSLAYDNGLPLEEKRVRGEAAQMVTTHFAQNAVVGMGDDATFATNVRFGVAPGNTLKLKLPLKNAGARALLDGVAQVRLLETSPNISVQRGQAPVPALTAGSLSNNEIDFGIKVGDDALPGQKIRLVAQITYPGNDYVASRTERVVVEEALGVNPAVTSGVSFNSTPSVDGLFGGINEHKVDVTLTARHNGSPRGHRVVIEEVGTRYASFQPASVDLLPLKAGQGTLAVLKYKLQKAAKKKTLTFKVKVLFGQELLEEKTLTLRPE